MEFFRIRKDIPFMRGVGNLDEVRLEFFGDETAAFEAFKVGEVNTHREFNVAKWDSQFDFELFNNGDIVKSILPHERPSGMTGFVMNSRRDQFSDWRVRDAMMQAFNFEFIKNTVNSKDSPEHTEFMIKCNFRIKPLFKVSRMSVPLCNIIFSFITTLTVLVICITKV